MKNKIEDLRNHLFASLERLNDEETTFTPETLAREKTIAEVSQVLVNSVKMEVEYMKASKRLSVSGFIPEGEMVSPPKQIKESTFDEV